MHFKRKLPRRIASLALGIAALLVGLALVLWFHRFFPTSRLELPSPGREQVRAFTLNEGFVDMSINLYASDWPHTFSAPARLGDLYWPERYSAGAYWSGDGSVVVIKTWWNGASGSYFTAAYDFREHRHLQDKYASPDGGEMHHRISNLLEARSGLGQAVPGEDGKGGEHPYSPMPLWVWIPPLIVTGCGWRAAMRLGRKTEPSF